MSEDLKRLKELQEQRAALQRQHAVTDAIRDRNNAEWRERTAPRGGGKIRLPNGQ